MALGVGRGAKAGQRDALDAHDRQRVGDPAVDRHRERLVEGHPADRQVLRRVGLGLALGQPGRKPQQPELVGDGVRQRVGGDLPPLARAHPGLLLQLAPDPVERILVRGHAAFGDLPGVGVQGVAVLTDEQQPVGIVEHDHA